MLTYEDVMLVRTCNIVSLFILSNPFLINYFIKNIKKNIRNFCNITIHNANNYTLFNIKYSI